MGRRWRWSDLPAATCSPRSKAAREARAGVRGASGRRGCATRSARRSWRGFGASAPPRAVTPRAGLATIPVTPPLSRSSSGTRPTRSSAGIIGRDHARHAGLRRLHRVCLRRGALARDRGRAAAGALMGYTPPPMERRYPPKSAPPPNPPRVPPQGGSGTAPALTVECVGCGAPGRAHEPCRYCRRPR